MFGHFERPPVICSTDYLAKQTSGDKKQESSSLSQVSWGFLKPTAYFSLSLFSLCDTHTRRDIFPSRILRSSWTNLNKSVPGICCVCESQENSRPPQAGNPQTKLTSWPSAFIFPRNSNTCQMAVLEIALIKCSSQLQFMKNGWGMFVLCKLAWDFELNKSLFTIGKIRKLLSVFVLPFSTNFCLWSFCCLKQRIG